MKVCICCVLIAWCLAMSVCHAENVQNSQETGEQGNVVSVHYAVIPNDLVRWLINASRLGKGIATSNRDTLLRPQYDDTQSKESKEDDTSVPPVDDDTDDVSDEDQVIEQTGASLSESPGKRPILWYGYRNTWSGKPRRAFDRIGHYSSFGRFSKRARWLGLFGHRPSWLKWINIMNPNHPHHGVKIRFAEQ